MPPNRAYDVLDGMGEAILSLARAHCTPQQWSAWLKVPLQAGAAVGDLTMVEALLKAGAGSSGERERDGQTPLHAAAEGGSLAIVTTLLKGRARRDVNKLTRGSRQSPLYFAVKRGHGDVALALIRAGADVNYMNAAGWTPLMRATADGRADLVNNLLLSGAMVNARSKEGSRPLHYAVENGHLEVTKVLLKAGAMCSRRKCDGMSALGLAVEKGYIDVLRELLAAGTNPDGVNDDGLTALHIAAQDGQVEAIDVLIAAGADAESRDDDDDTPLHAACSSLQPDSVRALLRQGASETLLNDEYEEPGDVIGNSVEEDLRDEDVVEWIVEMLARAPADRVWRRRGWLAMINARRRRNSADAVVQVKGQLRSRGSEPPLVKNGKTAQETTDEKIGPMVVRRRKDEGSREEGEDAVHPSLKKFHSTVMKLVDVTDELVFRRIVSFL